MKTCILFFLAGLMSGCSTTIGVDDNGRSIIHNFGYVRIVLPPKYSPKAVESNNIDFSALGIKTIGIQGSTEGMSVGYSSSSRINIPMDCRFVAIVKNRSQLKHLLNTIKQINGDQLCITVSPD